MTPETMFQRFGDIMTPLSKNRNNYKNALQKELKYSKFVWLKKANKKTLARIESVCTFVYTLIYEKIF